MANQANRRNGRQRRAPSLPAGDASPPTICVSSPSIGGQEIPGVIGDQTAQNYDTLVFGDVATPFSELADSPSQTAPDDGTGAGEVPAMVATLALPNAAVDPSATDFIAQVTPTTIDAKNKLVEIRRSKELRQKVADTRTPKAFASKELSVYRVSNARSRIFRNSRRKFEAWLRVLIISLLGDSNLFRSSIFEFRNSKGRESVQHLEVANKSTSAIVSGCRNRAEQKLGQTKSRLGGKS